MKKNIFLFLIVFVIAANSCGMSLNEAVMIFYKKNNQLKSEKTKIKEAKASAAATLFSTLPDIRYGKNIEQSGYFRMVDNSTIDIEKINKDRTTFSISENLSLGGTIIAPKKGMTLLQAQKVSFRINEQNLLLGAIEAYLNVIRDEEILRTSLENVSILDKYATLVKRRFDFGEVTKTDVEQSKARLSGAQSTKIQAEGSLKVAKANFVQIFGFEPKNLLFPKSKPKIPETFDEFQTLSRKQNLNLKYSSLNKSLSKQDLAISTNGILPSISVSKMKVKNDDSMLQQGIKEKNSTEIGLSVPILPRGGSEYLKVIQSKYAVNRAIYDDRNAKYDVDSKIISAWENLQTTHANIKSAQDTVDFNKSAFESVKKEAQYGSRTTLDVLNAELEYFNAKVNLIKMQNADLLSYYRILAIMGLLDINIFNKN